MFVDVNVSIAGFVYDAFIYIYTSIIVCTTVDFDVFLFIFKHHGKWMHLSG